MNSERPPVVAIMGHIDHGKSTLLDYIRKSNIVDGEAGGITQHLSAYEVVHKDEKGNPKKITFIDTPGHEAFSGMRERGANVADIAILIVSAEDGVKAQTKEALKTILNSKTPYIVAINKIDKPGANPEKVKMDLNENEVFLEGYGGQIPYVEISAKAGTGIDTLLETILIVAEVEGFTGDHTLPASGIIIESHLDPKRGITATMVIKNGTLKKGMFVVIDDAIVNTRIMEDFLGKQVGELTFSSPLRLTGFDKVPNVGSIFTSYTSKKEAEQAIKEHQSGAKKPSDQQVRFANTTKLIPIVIKTDVVGTAEAIEKEILKLNTEDISFKVIGRGVGSIGENDIKLAYSDKDAIIIGFNVKVEKKAQDMVETTKATVEVFNVIYKLTDWLKELQETRRPRKTIMETTGKTKIIRCFSATRDRQVVGGRVEEGKLGTGNQVRIMRRDFEIGTGKIVGVEMGKMKAKEVEEGNECGILVETKIEVAPGDYLESFILTEK